jgi:hypothetical protein
MRRSFRPVGRYAVVVVLVLALAACAAPVNGVPNPPGQHVAGFWYGLWQGFICPITLIISWFSDSVGIYDVHNNGGWYDTGFVLGASIFFGSGPGSGAARRRRRKSVDG